MLFINKLMIIYTIIFVDWIHKLEDYLSTRISHEGGCCQINDHMIAFSLQEMEVYSLLFYLYNIYFVQFYSYNLF